MARKRKMVCVPCPDPLTIEISAAELARLRQNSERWEFLCKHFAYADTTTGKESVYLNANDVDAAIAAEKGAGDA